MSKNKNTKFDMNYASAQVSGDFFETNFLPIFIDSWHFHSIEIEKFYIDRG
jgi:hypothetical protein